MKKSIAAAFAILLAGCVSTGRSEQVDHSLQIRRVGNAQIVDVRYTYGVLRDQKIGRLSVGGDGVTESMPIPDTLDVNWTTEADGKAHEAQAPIHSKISKDEIGGNIVRVEIEGSSLRVLLVKRLRNFQERVKQIY